ncbi:MAG: tandem-95 repeat protein [Thermoplasmata archaeon]|nr:MAG: tandem-95 repeat protein [Thermoplasmata archaeon]
MASAPRVKRTSNFRGLFTAFLPIVIMFIMFLSSAQSGLATDPILVDNGDYTFTAIWEFEDLTNYTMSNLTTSNGEVNLTINNLFWNQSNAMDFVNGQRTNVVEGDGIVISSDYLLLGYLQNQNFTSPYNWNYANGTDSKVISQWDEGEFGWLYSSYPKNISIQTINIQPDETVGIDSYINENSQGSNYGGDDNLRVQKDANDRRALLWFDVSQISDSKVIDAHLELYFYSSEDASSLDVAVYRVENSWSESIVNWIQRDAVSNWVTSGGDYDPLAVDTVALTNSYDWVSWNITSLVDGWVNGTYENNGVLLDGPTGTNTWKEFYSSDYASLSFRPKLNITYYPLNSYNETANITQVFPLLDQGGYRDLTVTDFGLGTVNNATVSPARGGQVTLGSEGYYKFDPLENISYWGEDPSVNKNSGSFQLSTTVFCEGAASMRLDYDLALGKHTYGVRRTTSSSWDWSRYTDLCIWVRSSGQGEIMKVLIEDSIGASWESSPTPLFNSWSNYTFDLRGFPGDISSINAIRLHFADTTLPTTTFVDNITLIGGAPYLTEGEFFSRIFDGGYSVLWKEILWEEFIVPGTTIEIRTRTGNNSTPGPLWSGWSAPYSTPEGSIITSPEGRFIQYHLNLTTTNTDNTPSLTELTLIKSEYNLTYTYSIDAFENVTWAQIFLKLNEEILWEKTVTGLSTSETITFDIGKYLYKTGDTTMEFGLTVSANSSKDVNISIIVDDFQIKGPTGFYTSQVHDTGSEAFWGDVTWDADIPPATGIILNTRTSMDNITWSTWSAPIAYPSDTITNPMGRYIQYRVNFTTNILGITPVFKAINITYTKHFSQGTITFINDLIAENVTNWGVLSAGCDLRGQSIRYEYSIDSGVTWNPIASDLNLSSVSVSTNKIRFKAILETGNTSLTPTLYALRLTYSVNKPPVIVGIIPNQEWYEDWGPWSIDLTVNESDFEDSGNRLRWYLTGENTSLFTVEGEYSSEDVITFTPQPDAFGCDEVTLWLEDSFGARTSQILWINITPFDDPPEIQGVIPSFQKYENDPSWQLDLSGYKYDKDDPPSALVWAVQGVDSSLLSIGVNSDMLAFTLQPDSYGNDEITIILTDGENVTLQNIWVNVTIVNKPPTISGTLPSFLVGEDNPDWILDLTQNETDREDQEPSSNLVWHIVGLNTSLLSASITDNNITFSLLPDVYGKNEITIILEDSEGLTDTQKIWINVTSENDAPVIYGVVPNFEKYENAPDWNFDLSSYMYDVDNSSHDLSWSVEGWDALLFDNVTMVGNVITFDLAMDAIGNDLLTINLSDGLSWDIQDIWVNVTPINKAPIIYGTISSFEKNEDDPAWILDVTLNETDREDGYPSRNLVWSVLGVNNSLLTVTILDNNITFTLVPNAFGNNEITLILTDSNNATDTQNIWINVTSENDAPIIFGAIPNFEKIEDAPFWTLNLSSYKFDVDNDVSELTWEVKDWDTSLFDLSVDKDVFTFTLVSNAYGSYEMIIHLNDSEYSDSQSIWINVSPENDAPSITKIISNFDTKEDNASWVLDLTTYESDIEDPYPSLILEWSVFGVDPNLLTITIIDNNLTFILKPDANGNNEIIIFLTDSMGAVDSQSIWINVSAKNDAPTILGTIPSFEKNEDSPNWNLNLSSFKYDVDNASQELYWIILGGNAPIFDTIGINGDLITFDLASDAFGSYEITFILSDNLDYDSQNIWINVTPVNDAPVINRTIPDYDKSEDDAQWTIDLTTYERDIEDVYPSDSLSWSVLGVDSNLLSVEISDNNLTFSLNPDAYGNDEITIILSDSNQAVDFQNIWINVAPENDAPTIMGTIPNFERDEDAAIWSLNLSSYKYDVDNLKWELSWDIQGANVPLFDFVDLNGDIITFDLAQDAYGSYELTIELHDKDIYTTQNFWVNVTSINDAPAISDTIQDMQRLEDSLPWTLDLTEYEEDVEDGSPSRYLIWSISDVDSSLILISITDNNITFTPVPDAFGLNYVTIKLTDSLGAFDTQIVLIEIISVNDAPTIQSSVPNIVLDEDTSTSISLLGYGSDIEDTPNQLRWSILNANNSLYSWQIEAVTNLLHINTQPNAYGINYVTLELIDTQGATAYKQIQVRVISENDQPYIQPSIPQSLFETLEDEPISVILTGYENDVEDPDFLLNWEVRGVDTSKIKVSVIFAKDELIIVPLVTFSPQDTESIETEITLVLMDSGGLFDSQNVTVKIIPVNNAPIIDDLPDLVIKFDDSYIFDISPYVYDEDTQKSQLKITTSEPSEDLGYGFITVAGLNLIFEYPQSRVGDPFTVLITVSDGHLHDYGIIQVTISDHSPPELKEPIPNVYFDEDSSRYGAFDLDDHFEAKNDGSLNSSVYLDYSYHGNEYVFVIINKNNTVDFMAAQDWYGMERITFRAKDNYGSMAEYTMIVTVNPINDPPIISVVPDQECKINVTKTLNLDPYISDVDTLKENLMIATDSTNIIISGHDLMLFYDEVTIETVNIIVSDGFSQDGISIEVRASANKYPIILTIPDLVVGGGEVYLFSLLPYVSDADNEIEDLQIWTDSEYITPNANDNMLLQLDFPSEMIGGEVTVTLYVSDGLDTNFSWIKIKVTDDLVPTLISNLPNLLFEEDTQLSNAINLNDYFQNASEYQYFGNENVNIVIQDNWVTFSASENWSGTEMITFRGVLGEAFVEDTIEVVVKPVDDPPTLSSLPSFEKKVNEIWTLNILDYIHDIDTPLTDMTISVDSPYVIQYAMNIYFQYQTPIYDRITITVSDGVNTVFGVVHVNVTAENNAPSYVGLLRTAHLTPGETWSIDLDDYFYDLDGDGLSFSCNQPEIIIDPVTHVASWTPTQGDKTLTNVIFYVSDGSETIESSPIDLVVTQEKSSPSFWEQYWWIFLLIALLAASLLALIIKRREEEEEEIEYKIDEEKAVSYLSTKGGGNYLIKSDSSDSAYKVFSGLMQAGFEGLCITTKRPEDLSEQYDLGRAWIIRLTLRGQKTEDGEEETRMMGLLALGDEGRMDEKYIFSSNFNTIVETIEEFLMGGDHKVVLLDGLEYILGGEELIMYIGFIASVRERLKDRNSCLLIPIDPKTLSEKELRLLERETEHLGELLEKSPKELKEYVNDISTDGVEITTKLAEAEDELTFPNMIDEEDEG